MATGVLPFQGETSAVIYEAILNRDPVPVTQLNPNVPPEFARILEKAWRRIASCVETLAAVGLDFLCHPPACETPEYAGSRTTGH